MSEQPEDIRRAHFTDPLGALIDFVEEADRVLDMSARGISAMRALPQAIKAIAKAKPLDDADEQLARAEDRARFAEHEIENEFPLLHAHTVVAIWSALEASIPKFAAGWLVEKPATLERPAFERIKVSVGPYEQMPIDGRMAYIVDHMLQELRSGSPGVARYEGLLDNIGLGGKIPDGLRRDLSEMSQVRNLIVHQFSIVDQRFAAACPWLKVRPGNRFNVNHLDYCRYRNAVLRYVTEVAERVTEARSQEIASAAE